MGCRDVTCVHIYEEFMPGQHSQHNDQATDWKHRDLNPSRAMRLSFFFKNIQTCSGAQPAYN
jgi:hypothetical protein